MWSSVLGLWLGTWRGEFMRQHDTWLRFFDQQGHVVLVAEEAQRLRADAAEAELTRLRALLSQHGSGDQSAPSA